MAGISYFWTQKVCKRQQKFKFFSEKLFSILFCNKLDLLTGIDKKIRIIFFKQIHFELVFFVYLLNLIMCWNYQAKQEF